MVQRKKRLSIIDILLIGFTLCISLFLTFRIFSFYTLPHLYKPAFIGYLTITIGLFLLRFFPHLIEKKADSNNRLWISTVIAVLISTVILLSPIYHIAPIRTTHTLEIRNESASTDVIIDKIYLPGDETLNLVEAYPSYPFKKEALILRPGAEFSYVREMVGSVKIQLQVNDPMAKIEISWDGLNQTLKLNNPDDTIIVSLLGWTWGAPSNIYRLVGYFSIVIDWLTLFGITFSVVFLGIPKRERKDLTVRKSIFPEILQPYTDSIVINLSLIVIAGIYNLFLSGSQDFTLFIFVLGLLISVIKTYPKSVYLIAFGTVMIGIGVNVDSWINPKSSMHLTLSLRPDNSYAYLADWTGPLAPTYFSMGYYKYLRESKLVFPEPLFEELDFFEYRLRRMNQIQDIEYLDYEYQLTDEEDAFLLSMGDWFIWPNRTGGEYYLLPTISEAGDTYYFFSYGNKYFVLPLHFLKESGVIDVPFLD